MFHPASLCALTAYRHGIYTLDAGYDRQQLASIHLIIENGRVALVDTGVNASFAFVEKALAQLALRFTDIDWVLLTHVHLDHAGGAGKIMQHASQARLVVHPRGSRHMADPSKLMAGTLAVYGEAATKRLYGELVPVPTQRIVETHDGMLINLSGRNIHIFDTPGHAKHHVSYWDPASKSIFTGDTFGISYREMDEPDSNHVLPRQFIFPTTTPVHFDPPTLIQSIDRLIALAPEVAYLTHFGELRQLPPKAATLKRQIQALAALALKHQHAGESRYQKIRADLDAYLLAEAEVYGTTLGAAQTLSLWEGDLNLNAQGLVIWLDGQI